jgi:hypothetical protein
LLNLYSLCNLCIHLLYFSNLQFLLLHRRNRPLNHNLLQTYSPLPDQVVYNLKPTNLIYNLARISTTKNSTQASSKDAENFVTRPRPSLQSWLRDHSHHNHLLQAHLQTKERQPNHRDPMVIIPSTFCFKPSTQEAHTHRLHFLTT